MSGGSVVEHIDAVDAFARTLYVRAKQSPAPSLATDVAFAVGQLHLALRHLRVEAADPDSLLNAAEPSVYSRQLNPIVRDSERALGQLETVLDQYGAVGDHLVDGMADGVATVQSKLVHEKTVIDVFLDLVQLDGAANIDPSVAVDNNSPGLEVIKDKVDVVARRLFSRRDNGMTADDDGLWQEFKAELEKEGFLSKVLDEHKDILRAYIRGLESMLTMNAGAPPTLRGLLECEARSTPTYSKDIAYSSLDNHKGTPRLATQRSMPDHGLIPTLGSQLSNEYRSTSSDENGGEMSGSLALISTRDLMAMDALNAGMEVPHLQSPTDNQGTSPSQVGQRFLTYGMSGALPPPVDAELSRSANSQLGVLHPIAHLRPPYSTGGQHTYGSSAPSAYGTGLTMPHLAPDSCGRDISMDAQWTKIKRTLVSPEVLHMAGVRYEARPDYVAILGRLSRDQIAHYARLSAECRAARLGKPPPRRHDRREHKWTDSKSSLDENEDDSESGHQSDTTNSDDDKTSEKGTKSYPFIVSPPEKNKTSPASTVMPKPILKNKNTNHVRFDPEPYEVEPRSERDDADRREYKSSRRNRERDGRDGDDYSRHRDGGRGRRDSDRYCSGDKYRAKDDDHYRPSRSDRDRRDDRREGRAPRRRTWGSTLGAVGIGGAAVSLLGVLAEAAVGM